MIKDEKQDVIRDASSVCSKESIKPRFSILAEFKRSQLLLRHFISRYMISSHDIEDVSQETFLRAFKAEQQKKLIFQKHFCSALPKI